MQDACGNRLFRPALHAANAMDDYSSRPLAFLLLLIRLSVMIFLTFAVLGSWVPVFSHHLGSLHFTPGETALACSTNAIGALLAPILWGQVADRWLAAERCLSLCSLVAGSFLWTLAGATQFWPVFWLCVGFWFFAIPVFSLGSSLIFRQLDQPERDFGKIRLWGTLGWVASSWTLTAWFSIGRAAGQETETSHDLADSLRMGAIFALVLGVYALTLPHAPPSPRRHDGSPRSIWRRLFDAPLLAMKMFHQRAFTVYAICMFGVYATMAFTTQVNPLLFKSLGYSDRWLPTILTIAQSSEVVMLLVLPWLLRTFDLKPTMIFGLAAWTFGLLMLAVGRPAWLVAPSLAAHGVFICCFLISGQVFVNKQADRDIRASAQGLLHWVSGSGMLTGNLLVGLLRHATGDHFPAIYAPAALAAAGLLAVFVAFFAFSLRHAATIPLPLAESPEAT